MHILDWLLDRFLINKYLSMKRDAMIKATAANKYYTKNMEIYFETMANRDKCLKYFCLPAILLFIKGN